MVFVIFYDMDDGFVGILIGNNYIVNMGCHTVETGHALSLQPPQTSHHPINQQRFLYINKNSASSIIGSYINLPLQNMPDVWDT